MSIKAKHEELNNVFDVMTKDGDSYDVEIEKMLKEVEELRTIWSGVDAKAFCDNFEGYLTKMKNIPIALRNMSKYGKKVDRGYIENDEAFAKELEKEATNYDEPNANN